MIISKKDWLSYINRLSKLNSEAANAVKKYVEAGGWSEIDDIVAYAYGVEKYYGEGAAALAAEMFDAVAEASGVYAEPAIMAETASYGDVAKTVKGVLKTSQNVNELAGAVSRLVKKAGADTTVQNVNRYNRKYGKKRHTGAQFAWVPVGDTCPFCLMLASNGWQNQTRGGENHAEHIHSNCDCNYSVRFDNHSGVAGYDPEQYQKMFDDVEGNTWEEKVNALRRQQYEQNKDQINAQKRDAYALRTKSDMLAAEASLRTKGGGDYGVNFKIVKSKEYTKRFNALSDNQEANELAAQRARNALINRSGKKTEEIYAISLTSGKDVSKIIDQHHDFAIERTDKFIDDIQRAVDNGQEVLLIHNHPRGFPPSIVDINELLNHTNVNGITVGHNGSIYYYSKPTKEIDEDEFTVAKMHFKMYTDEKVRHEKALELLAKKYSFEFKIL